MNSAADLGGIFIVLDATVTCFAQIINMGGTGPWETDWITFIHTGLPGHQSGRLWGK